MPENSSYAAPGASAAMPEVRYLTLTEAADLARVALSTLRWWLTAKGLRWHKPGRHRLVRLDDLQAFIEGKCGA